MESLELTGSKVKFRRSRRQQSRGKGAVNPGKYLPLSFLRNVCDIGQLAQLVFNMSTI